MKYPPPACIQCGRPRESRGTEATPPHPYPHKHAISDQEQGELDVLIGAARMELGDTNLFNGRAA